MGSIGHASNVHHDMDMGVKVDMHGGCIITWVLPSELEAAKRLSRVF